MKLSFSIFIFQLMLHLLINACLIKTDINSNYDDSDLYDEDLENFNVQEDWPEEFANNEENKNDVNDFNSNKEEKQKQDFNKDVRIDTEETMEHTQHSYDYSGYNSDEFEGLESINEKNIHESKQQKSRDNSKNFADNKNNLEENLKTQNKKPFYMKYPYEIFALLFLGLYVYQFINGRKQNENIACLWQHALKSACKSQFSALCKFASKSLNVVSKDEVMLKESQSDFRFYATGRRYCQGFLAVLELQRRQDLLSYLQQFLEFLPNKDVFKIEIAMDIDLKLPFVMLLCKKENRLLYRKQFEDIKQLAFHSSKTQKNSEIFSLQTDCPELETKLFDNKTVKLLQNYKDLINYIHISDRNSISQSKGTSIELEIFLPNISKHYSTVDFVKLDKDENYLKIYRLIEMSLFLIDRLAELKISRDALQNSEKIRQKIEIERQKAAVKLRQESSSSKKANKDELKRSNEFNEYKKSLTKGKKHK